MINDDDFQKKITGKLESLNNKTLSCESTDKLITIYISGVGDFKRVCINKDLSEIDSSVLEADILEAINKSKTLVSSNVMEALTDTMDEETNSDGVDVENVS